MFATIFIVAIIFTLCTYHFGIRYSRSGRLIDRIPGPSPLPLIGNLLPFIFSKDNIWVTLREMNKQFTPIGRYWISSYPVVMVMHPDDVEKILSNTNNITKGVFYNLLHSWFGTGLLTSTGSKWQQRRKLLTPAFHFNILQKYSEIIVEHNERLIKSMNTKDEFVLDVMPFVTKYSLSVICEAAMGIKLHEDENLLLKYLRAVQNFGEIWAYRIIRPWFHNDKIFNQFPMGHRLQNVLKILRGFSSSIIRKRQEYHDQTQERYLQQFTLGNDDETETFSFGIKKKRLAMLDLLIAAYRQGDGRIDEEGIQEEVDTFVFEGHDTTSMAMCFTILLIAEHKEAQDRARAEVNQVLQQYGKLGINELQNCAYLERCIKESLRLYPSVPSIGRVIEHEITLRDHVIPKDSTCLIHMYELHRDPNYWKNPLKFDPDRFLPEEIKGRHPYCYVPFSAGPRNCIGQKFAMMELKSFIGTLLHNFYFEAIDIAHSTPILLDLVMRPEQSLRVKFIPIDHETRCT